MAEVNVERFQKQNCHAVPAALVFTQFLLGESAFFKNKLLRTCLR
jgi:hypothetical protein